MVQDISYNITCKWPLRDQTERDEVESVAYQVYDIVSNTSSSQALPELNLKVSWPRKKSTLFKSFVTVLFKHGGRNDSRELENFIEILVHEGGNLFEKRNAFAVINLGLNFYSRKSEMGTTLMAIYLQISLVFGSLNNFI